MNLFNLQMMNLLACIEAANTNRPMTFLDNVLDKRAQIEVPTDADLSYIEENCKAF